MQNFIEAVSQWFHATAWTCPVAPAYGALHLAVMAIGFPTCFLLARRLRKLSDRGNRILLVGIGLLLMLTEVYKQLFYQFVIGDGGYNWGIFPFHLCSIPMYLCVIAPLLKPGPVQQGMYGFMMLYNLLGGAIAFVEPSGLLHGYVTLTIHALLWHMLLVFIGLYLVFSGRAGSEKLNYRTASFTFLALCGIAFCINVIFRRVSNGAINMFFVGPSNSSLIVFKQISEAFGWYVSTALYIPVVCLGAYLLFLLIRFYRSSTAAPAQTNKTSG